MKLLKQTIITALMFFSSACSVDAQLKPQDLTSNFETRLLDLFQEPEDSLCLSKLCDLYWDWSMENSPEAATYYGYLGMDNRWSDLSLSHLEQQNDFIRQIRKVLDIIDPSQLKEEEQITYQVLKRDLDLTLEQDDYLIYYMPVNQMHGIHLDIPMLIQMMPHVNYTDYQNIIARLQGIGKLIDQCIDLMDKGLETGITPPRITLMHVPPQVLNLIVQDPLQSPLLEAFQNFPDTILAEDQEALLTQAKQAYSESVSPAFQKLYTYLVDQYIPNSRSKIACEDLPNGKKLYDFYVRHATTTNLSPEAIHTIGLKEVERIHQEMLDVMNSLKFQGGFKEFLHFLETDSQFFYSNREDLLQGYRDLTKYIESQLPSLFSKLPQLPFHVIPIPSYSEETQIGAYYCHGSIAHQRPGYFFINTSFPEIRPKWEMIPLALHEAVPGHHLQIALAQEIEGLPEFRKQTGTTAYIEGWGLYAESLGEDLGLYQDPYAHFGRLTYEMLRAIRLVVDTGLHAKQWSRQQAIDYFKQYVGMSEHEIKTEVDRYLVMPGQALAYKIGELKIKEMRQLAANQLQDKFDIRQFHNAWLQHGALPLELAEQLTHKWIEQQLNNPES